MSAVTTKACVACGKLIAQSFATCAFCKAEQPRVQSLPPAKEKRCDACRRPFAAKLDECPFCARAKIGGGPPSSSGSLPSATQSSGRYAPIRALPDDDEDDDNKKLVSSILVFAVPLVLGSIFGIVEIALTTRLGEGSLLGPSIAIGIVVAPILGVLFIRRILGGDLGESVEDRGLPKVAGFIAAATAAFLLPVALTLAGIVIWFNGLAISDREHDVACKAGTITHHVQKGTDSGWSVSYTCELEGQPLVGTVDRLMTKPEIEENGPLKFRAAKGRAGIWLRLSHPLPPTAITTSPPGGINLR